MHHILPGIHDFPMSQRLLLRTREKNRAVQVIHQLAEPFNFRWERKPVTNDIQVTGALLERVKIFGVRHGASVRVNSSPLQSYYIVLPLQGELIGRINKVEIKAIPGEGLVFPAASCFHTYWKNQCTALVLSIGKEELQQEARSFSANENRSLLPAKLNLSEGPGRSFTNVLACLCADCDLQSDGDSIPLVRQSLQQALLTSLLQMNGESGLIDVELERASTKRRRAGVARAVDYLHLNINCKVDIQELSQKAFLSKRSLQIGFNECFGMGPMAYSKRLRISRAREELLNTNSRYLNIIDLAARWGFQCDNSFRRLYRQHYKELPSQTLSRAGRNKTNGLTA